MQLETLKAEHDSKLHKDDVRAPMPVLMEELRGMNQVRGCVSACCSRPSIDESSANRGLPLQLKLDEIDTAKRHEEAQKPANYVASGGLTGFRVAADLYSKHLTDAPPDPEAWRQAPKKK